jgi:hypothetical protein
LTTEIELMNSTCLTCFQEDEREAKIRVFDDLLAACRGIIHLAPRIAFYLPSCEAGALERQVESLRTTLCQAGVL